MFSENHNSSQMVYNVCVSQSTKCSTATNAWLIPFFWLTMDQRKKDQPTQLESHLPHWKCPLAPCFQEWRIYIYIKVYGKLRPPKSTARNRRSSHTKSEVRKPIGGSLQCRIVGREEKKSGMFCDPSCIIFRDDDLQHSEIIQCPFRRLFLPFSTKKSVWFGFWLGDCSCRCWAHTHDGRQGMVGQLLFV